MSDDDARRLLEEFFGQWSVSAGALRDSFYSMMAPDCAFENPGFPTVYGPVETEVQMIIPCTKLIEQDTIRVDVIHMLVKDSVAFHERVDHVLRADGSEAIRIPVTGVMELTEEGKIKAWREYFDSRPVLELVSQNEPPAPPTLTSDVVGGES